MSNHKENSGQLFPLCYHDNLNNIDQVLDLMRKFGDKDGLYIVRNSFSEPGRLVLSVRHVTGLVHIKIDHCQDTQMYSLGKKSFKTFDLLLDHFSHHTISNEEKVSGVILKDPIFKIDRKKATTFCDNLYIKGNDCHPCISDRNENGYMQVYTRTSAIADDHYIGNSGYLTPTPPKRSTTTPTSNGSLKTENIFTLPCGWKIAKDTTRNEKFISPSGTAEKHLPSEIWLQVNDNQKQMLSRVLSQNLYMDMNKTNTKLK